MNYEQTLTHLQENLLCDSHRSCDATSSALLPIDNESLMHPTQNLWYCSIVVLLIHYGL